MTTGKNENEKRKASLKRAEILKDTIADYQEKLKTISTGFKEVEEGIEIIEKLCGYTSGLTIPYYVVNAPLGQGKAPMLPEYLVGSGKDHILIRAWENKILRYDN